MPLRLTGHPFVDAGMAALLVATEVQQPAQLGEESLEQACQELLQVMLSDQALGVGVEKAFVKGRLSDVFPNSELVNNANWKGGVEGVRRRYREVIAADQERARLCLASSAENGAVCSICGERRPEEALMMLRKTRMPLLEGIVNFYPAFSYGQKICGLCALCVRFLPMSLLRVGGGGRIWFLHTSSLKLASKVATVYGWEHLRAQIAKGEQLEFYDCWATVGREGSLLSMLFELLERYQVELRELYLQPLPTQGYVFSNFNQGGFVETLPIPHSLLRFLFRLFSQSPPSYRRFKRDLLEVQKGLNKEALRARQGFVRRMGQRMLAGESLVSGSLRHDPPSLLGGWPGHRLYLEEVRKMELFKIALLERLGLTLAQSEEAKKLTQKLRQARRNDLYRLLLSLVRRGLLTHEEFYQLVPPGGSSAIEEVRDLLLAVIYAWQACQNEGEEFPLFSQKIQAPSPEQMLQQLQEIGERLLEGLPNLPAWLGRLQTSRRLGEIRGRYLMADRKSVV
jgi:CRISPR-associated protein Cst1